jgi:hypothetical protein
VQLEPTIYRERTAVTRPKPKEIETIIPDHQAYQKFPVREGDDQEALVMKYRAAQLDTLIRLTGKLPEELKDAMRDPKIQELVRRHNTQMRQLDRTA